MRGSRCRNVRHYVQFPARSLDCSPILPKLEGKRMASAILPPISVPAALTCPAYECLTTTDSLMSLSVPEIWRGPKE